VTEVEQQLSLIYTAAFKNPVEWTQEDHINGLKAVFAAGSKARDKADAQATQDAEK
jgi:hypothetical protein